MNRRGRYRSRNTFSTDLSDRERQYRGGYLGSQPYPYGEDNYNDRYDLDDIGAEDMSGSTGRYTRRREDGQRYASGRVWDDSGGYYSGDFGSDGDYSSVEDYGVGPGGYVETGYGESTYEGGRFAGSRSDRETGAHHNQGRYQGGFGGESNRRFEDDDYQNDSSFGMNEGWSDNRRGQNWRGRDRRY